MRTAAIRNWASGLVCALGVLASASSSAYSNVYFFGDSLSDTGNVATMSLGFFPSKPYYSGRFSNGLLWTDTLAKGLGLSAKASLKDGTNYAFAGATVNEFGGIIPTLQDQLGFYYSEHDNRADANALYVILGGGNDISEAVKDTASAASKITQSASLVGDMTESLYNAGARNILVANLPNVGRTPKFTSMGSASAQTGTALSQLFDTTLANEVNALEARYSNLTLNLLDIYGLEQNLLANPSQFGFTNTTTACKSGDVGWGGKVCSNPNSYVYWDAFHPTARVHSLIGNAALSLVSPSFANTSLEVAAVPEPSTYALFAAGLVLVFGLKRRYA